MIDYVTMQVWCADEECGMYSVYKLWRDGSFQKVMAGCHHTKVMPTKAAIAEEFDAVQKPA